MRSLADRVLDTLPAFESAPLAQDVAEYLNTDVPHVRQAFERLEADGRAKIVRRGRGLHLVPTDYPGLICPVCRGEFVRSKKSKRVTCSRKCGIAWSWQKPGVRERRKEGISKQRQSPEGRANTSERNRRRWSDPKQRERLSKWNKDRWQDPYVKAELSVAIQKAQSRPDRVEFQRNQIKRRWGDAKGREKLVEGIRKSKRTPEARAKFSKLLSDRWKDPEMRAKYTAANHKRNAKLAEELRGKKQSPEHIAKRMKARKK